MNETKGCNPRIGVIADTSLQGHLLSSVVKSQGFELFASTDPAHLDQSLLLAGPDLWIVDLTQEDRWSDFLDVLLEQATAPILFSDGLAPARSAQDYPRWERRLLTKMLDYVERPVIEERLEKIESAKPPRVIPAPQEFSGLPVGEAPARVWVVGASLGGPAAVKLFLDCLPENLPVAFILAQHIDGGFIETLAKVLVRDNGFRCRVGYQGEVLAHGTVLIAPVDYEITFNPNGQILSAGKEWDGPYAPSIDQTIANASQCFRERAHVIMFSGMGNDGAIAAPQVAKLGSQVWAQSAGSCAVSSQPDSVRETGCVSFSGTPEQLALQLVDHVRRQIKSATTLNSLAGEQ